MVDKHFQFLGECFKRYKQDRWPILGMVFVTVLIALPVYMQRIYSFYGIDDYAEHIRYARLILLQEYHQVPASIFAHPLYQILLIGLYCLSCFKVSLCGIAVFIQVASQVFTSGTIYGLLGRGEKNNWNWCRAGLAVTLGMVAPVMVFAIWDKSFYAGYIGMATYHNPTTQLLKPVALASFVFALRVFSPGRSSWKMVLLSALLTILSALIKPSYLLCILPGMGLVAGAYLIRHRPIDWRLMLVGFLIPGVLILISQYCIVYCLPNNDNASVIWMPFAVMRGYSRNPLGKYLLSIVFPLVVLIVEFRRVRQDVTLQLAWAGFLVSILPMYLLAESGSRFHHGNFLWGAQIMLLILFVATVRYLWRERLAGGVLPLVKRVSFVTVYAAHFIAGIAYYVNVVVFPGYG
jgi:hypothetical protein